MLSSVLRSDRAVAVNIEIMRAFARLRHLDAARDELARELAALSASTDARFDLVAGLLEGLPSAVAENRTDIDRIREVLDALEGLLAGPGGAQRQIGFQVGEGGESGEDEVDLCRGRWWRSAAPKRRAVSNRLGHGVSTT